MTLVIHDFHEMDIALFMRWTLTLHPLIFFLLNGVKVPYGIFIFKIVLKKLQSHC